MTPPTRRFRWGLVASAFALQGCMAVFTLHRSPEVPAVVPGATPPPRRSLSILVAHSVRDRGRPADSTRAFIGNAALFETQKACRDSGDFSDMYLAPLDTDFRVEVDVVADVWTNPWTAGAYLVTCGILPMVAREDFAVHARLRRQDGSVVAECDCSSSYRVVATILLLPAGPFLHSDSPVYDCVLQSLALARAKGVL